MVTSRKSNETDDEDDGNLGDDEKEHHELENLSKKKNRKMKCQPYNSRTKTKRMKMVLLSSEEELLSSNFRRSHPRILPEENDVYSTLETSNLNATGFNRASGTTVSVCGRFNEALTISTPSSSHESRLPISLDANNVHRKNESSPIKCLNCKFQSRNSLLVHKRSGHQVFCYSCAQIWWRFNEKCPICNRKILQVIQISLE